MLASPKLAHGPEDAVFVGSHAPKPFLKKTHREELSAPTSSNSLGLFNTRTPSPLLKRIKIKSPPPGYVFFRLGPWVFGFRGPPTICWFYSGFLRATKKGTLQSLSKDTLNWNVPRVSKRGFCTAGAEAQDKRTHHVRSERCPSGSRISSWGLGPARAANLGNKSFQGGAISWRHGVMPRSGGQGQKAASVINCRAQCRSELFERFAARAASYNMYHQGPSRTAL